MREPSKLQKQAIIHLSGPAQVIAGPGSGKTFTIVHRILYLVYHCRISPGKILVITYTKAAAEEMGSRYKMAESEICSQKGGMGHGYEKVHFGTFHSICWQILRESVKKPLSLIRESEKRELIGQILKNNGYGGQNNYDLITEIINEISRSKNLPEPVRKDAGFREKDKTAGDLPYAEYLEVKNAYSQYLNEQGLVDFDDMITKCLELFYSKPAVMKQYQMQFEYILADEFQDINYPQYQMLKLLAEPHHNLFVVGDDDQAIYGFRGASPGIMKQFFEDYPQGKQFMLTENYRCGREIVCLADRMIRQNKNRFDKKFYPVRTKGEVCLKCFENRKQQEMWLVRRLKQLKPEELLRTAIILRTNMEVMQYGELLRLSGLPVRGRKALAGNPFGSFLMEDMTAFLSFIYLGNKRCDLLRFMNKPNRFLFRESLPGEQVMFSDFKKYYAKNADRLREIECFWDQLMLAGRLSPSTAVSLFRRAMGYDRYLSEQASDARQEAQWLRQAEQIQIMFGEYVPGADIHRFVKEKEKQFDVGQHEVAVKEGISLCTMHAAKGLEFDCVFLPDVNEGIIPGKKCLTMEALEEERRLLYVAVTRARDKLEITYTKERGRTLSRYLRGLIPHQ